MKIIVTRRTTTDWSAAGLTLLELLIVFGIIAIIAAVAFLVINPAELLRRARDTSRLTELDTLKSSVLFYQALAPEGFIGQSNIIYTSLPDDASTTCGSLNLPEPPSGWQYNCSKTADLRKTDGSGWVPIDFRSLSAGSPLSSLPVDPINVYTDNDNGDDDFYYVYAAGSFELAAKLESERFTGNYPGIDPDTGLYRVGTKKHLFPGMAGLCPSGRYWKPFPGRKCAPGIASGLLARASNVDFVLFAEKNIELVGKAQISSGRIGANQKIKIAEDNIISGDLFSDRIEIARNSQVNANINYNELITGDNVQILGSKTSPVSLPLGQLPGIPDFPVGSQNVVASQPNRTLNPGNYDTIEIETNASLLLNAGTYNLQTLRLKENAKLYAKPDTVINIKDEFEAAEHSAISPENLTDENPRINFSGKKTVSLADSSFLAFRLLAPRAAIQIGDNVTFRGKAWGKDIKIGGDAILSRSETTYKIADTADIITDPDGGVYPINEILVSFMPDAGYDDVRRVTEMINGRIVGVVNSISLYQIEVQTRTIADLENLMSSLRSRTDLKIDGIFRDFLMPEIKT